MANLTQQPPQGLQAQVAWCIEWIYQLRGRINSSGGGGDIFLPSTFVAFGGSDNKITYNSNFVYDPVNNNFLVEFGSLGAISFSGNDKEIILGDGDGNFSGGTLGIDWGLNRGQLSFSDSESVYLIVDAHKKSYAIGDGCGGSSPSNNGTKVQIDDDKQTILLSNVPIYANDAAAGIGGLTTGMLYKTTTLGITALNIVP